MSYAWRLWIGFTSVLMVVLAAMAVLSITALRLDRAEAEARRQAAIEEHVRLALWRMDSALAPLLAQENARPHYGLDTPPGDENAFVLLRFQYPVASGDLVDADADPRDQAAQVQNPSASADDLANRIPRQALLSKLAEADDDSSASTRVASTEAISQRNEAPPGDAKTVDSRAAVEFQQRNRSVMNNSMMAQQIAGFEGAEISPVAAMMTPFWISGEMLLARRIQRRGAPYVQGCLIDWQAMEKWLLETVSDLLPEAHLEPLEAFDEAGEPGLLAALPVRLIPGSLPAATQPPRSTLPQMLFLTWIAVLLSSLVGAVLVVGVVRLSQRRGDFVAAVTHELRTPLTTFRMYSEMLAQGMVRDPNAQREYLQTLQQQSLRLSHLVENVLAYARLERGRNLSSPENLSLAQLIDPILPSLHQLAASEQMELVVERTEAFESVVWANPSAVEQILVNLIDNAGKYAAGTADRRICLTAYRERKYVVLRMRDYGPGLPPKQKWFRPFSKSVQEAAHSSPGIGLGLALSRRLAEQMNGRLDVDRTTTNGAALLLRLPVAS